MYNFKRFLALMLVLCMGLCLCACGGGDSTTKDTEGTSAPTESTKPSETTKPTEPSTAPTSDGKVEYKVTVLYPDGTPAAGCYVMICLDDMCYTPEAADENGVAVFRLAEQDGYKAKLATKVEGYAEVDYIYFESGVTELTITLVAE